VTARTDPLFRHHDLAGPLDLHAARFEAPVPRRVPLLGRLTPRERTYAQITAGLPLGYALAWTADHTLQLLRAAL
jgi:hypothetical protein